MSNIRKVGHLMVCIVTFTEQSKDSTVPDCSAVSIGGLTSGSHEGSTECQPGQYHLYHVLCCVFLLCEYFLNFIFIKKITCIGDLKLHSSCAD